MPGRREWVCVVGVLGIVGFAFAGGANPTGQRDPVEIYYDGGDCGTEAIDLQVYDREARRWVIHPEHPRVPVPSCQVEDAGVLWNELRWRCAVPEGWAPWRNVAVFTDEVWRRCEELRVLEAERERIREAQRKRLELEAEEASDGRNQGGGEPRHGTASPVEAE